MALTAGETQVLIDITNLILEALPKREKDAISKKFGLLGEREHSDAEVADELRISESTVRERIASALRHLRNPGRARSLTAFLPDFEKARETLSYVQQQGLHVDEAKAYIQKQIPEVSPYLRNVESDEGMNRVLALVLFLFMLIQTARYASDIDSLVGTPVSLDSVSVIDPER